MKNTKFIPLSLDDYTISVMNQYKNRSELVRLLVRLLTNQDKSNIIKLINQLKK